MVLIPHLKKKAYGNQNCHKFRCRNRNPNAVNSKEHRKNQHRRHLKDKGSQK